MDYIKPLQVLADSLKQSKLSNEFSKDSTRAEKYTIVLDNLLADFSKTHINDDVMKEFRKVFETIDFNKSRDDMFSGKKINETEGRAVLHTAMRSSTGKPVYVDDENVIPKIQDVFNRVQDFVEGVHSGKILGATGKKLTNIIHIGIGGSILGTKMAIQSLTPFHKEGFKCRFLSNVDGHNAKDVLQDLDAETTLVIVVSKSFTTQETLSNANLVREWLIKSLGKDSVAKHMVAISTAVDKVEAFGIKNIFGFWTFVGGRFSIWSATGISLALMIGWNNYKLFLKGAEAADEHFRTQPLEKNIPMLMGALGLWYRNCWNAESYAIIPYNYYMENFALYIQQVDMESNGKNYNKQGKRVSYQTTSTIFGTAGTDAQHSFFQLLHQGTSCIPVDFIGFAKNHHGNDAVHRSLLSNFFAQSMALMLGKDDNIAFKKFEGNRPSITIFAKELEPYTLGMIMAFYEHKVFVQGLLWNIYSFDQFGVELGKQMADSIVPLLENGIEVSDYDKSTNNLINWYKKWR